MNHQVVSVKVYAAVFCALLALTITTVAVSKFELGEFNFIAAMTIAVIKGTLVVMFFMDVRRATSMTKLFVGALGVVTVTGEYASGLIRGTFVATPQRAQVLVMRALVFTVVVWACCTAMSFAAFFLGQSVLSPAKHVGIGDPGVLTAVFGAGLYLTLVGLLGMFIGVLVRHTPAALVYFAFDLLHLDGEDLTRRRLLERKVKLEALLRRAESTVRFSDHVVGNGDYDADGTSDLLLRHDDGMLQLQHIHANLVTSTANLGQTGSEWHVI